jgi:hypothetical protein
MLRIRVRLKMKVEETESLNDEKRLIALVKSL